MLVGVRRADRLTRRAALLRRLSGTWRHHHQALRVLGNRLVGILHGCLARRVAYQEQLAWPTAEPAA
jgi:hypothetical protein